MIYKNIKIIINYVLIFYSILILNIIRKKNKIYKSFIKINDL